MYKVYFVPAMHPVAQGILYTLSEKSKAGGDKDCQQLLEE